ncbi:MAG: nucleotidyltransferase family protein [Chloroflexi bacterium]|nr:nucleotidyltransferase family protein [Chloroflexota bacterium]MBV9893464.1 nucleotidyltransferase family protein [Chloroflexota bacterium]
MVSRRAAIILAAGASQRMGTPKALLPWGGSTLLEYAVQQARDAQADAVVVLGPATQQVSIDAVTVLNSEPESGRSASIRLGAAAVADRVEAVLVQSVDQPVPAWVLLALFAANAEIAVPTFGGQRGHPVCLAGTLLAELREVTEADQGLRAVVRRHTVTEVPVETEAILWNLNDPASYGAATAQS